MTFAGTKHLWNRAWPHAWNITQDQFYNRIHHCLFSTHLLETEPTCARSAVMALLQTKQVHWRLHCHSPCPGAGCTSAVGGCLVLCPFFVSASWYCNSTCNVNCSADSHKVKFSRPFSCKASQIWLLYSYVVHAPSVCSIPPPDLVRPHHTLQSNFSSSQLRICSNVPQ